MAPYTPGYFRFFSSMWFCLCVCVRVCVWVRLCGWERGTVCVCVMGGSYVYGFQFLWVSVRVSIRDGKTSIVAKMLFRCLRALSKYWAWTIKIQFQNSRMIFFKYFLMKFLCLVTLKLRKNQKSIYLIFTLTRTSSDVLLNLGLVYEVESGHL